MPCTSYLSCVEDYPMKLEMDHDNIPTASYTSWYHFHLTDCSERALLLAENIHADDKVR